MNGQTYHSDDLGSLLLVLGLVTLLWYQDCHGRKVSNEPTRPIPAVMPASTYSMEQSYRCSSRGENTYTCNLEKTLDSLRVRLQSSH